MKKFHVVNLRNFGSFGPRFPRGHDEVTIDNITMKSSHIKKIFKFDIELTSGGRTQTCVKIKIKQNYK